MVLPSLPYLEIARRADSDFIIYDKAIDLNSFTDTERKILNKRLGIKMNRRSRAFASNPPIHSEKENTIKENESIVGFNVLKVFDKKSIFCGVPSLNTVSFYIDGVVDNWHMLPSHKDSKWMARAKIAAMVWKFFEIINSTKGKIIDTSNLTEIDFGDSRDIITNLLRHVLTPDEVFKTSDGPLFTPPFELFRYKINDGYMYWNQALDDADFVKDIWVTKDLTKDILLDFIWDNLGRIIQLESYEHGLIYTPTELTEKKIFGSSNELIKKLRNDYEYFCEQKLSRGYLLIGKPGTGKTGIVNSIVNSTDGRVFIINGLTHPYRIDEMTSLFVQMKADFIIFDDCDRSQKHPNVIKAVLKMLESVKEKTPHTNFLFTANTFSGILCDDAVTRKGRIDQIYEIPTPNEIDRKEIIQKYSSEMEFELSENDLEKCINFSEGMTGADLKEICIQLQRATIEDVFARNKELETLKKKYPDPSSVKTGPYIYTDYEE